MTYRVYVLCTGTKETTRSQFLYRNGSQDKCVIAFYFWLIIGPQGPIVIDCGFDDKEAARRGVTDYRDRVELLAACGVAPHEVKQVFVTHLHYDHWSGYSLFPNAIFFIQNREIEFWRGPAGAMRLFNSSADMHAIKRLDDLRRIGRVRTVNGDWNVAPGLKAHLLGGHTPGLQALEIERDDGPILIAGDAFHFYENLATRTPVQVTVNMYDAVLAMDRVETIVQGRNDRALPGHDPLVMSRFAAVAPGVVQVC